MKKSMPVEPLQFIMECSPPKYHGLPIFGHYCFRIRVIMADRYSQHVVEEAGGTTGTKDEAMRGYTIGLANAASRYPLAQVFIED